ncbi:dihydroxyacetone kinase subunit DhaL [Methylomonas sp. AM2-LC]|uniref:dihydroxyacetone kinase subunit DhaL n=1 Tax=Methylomonas sp. AM2-LC TaxID=3153301 RepID=UPI003262CF19
MTITPKVFPVLIANIKQSLDSQAESITALDEAIGDGDHLLNLQRGLQALEANSATISLLSWPEAWQKIGMLLMSSVGGASGSLYATLFLSLHKHSSDRCLDFPHFSQIFSLAIAAVKQRGKSDVGEKTLLDVLIPVAHCLQQSAEANQDLTLVLDNLCQVAATGAEATRDMLATKGRASFLGERSRGHIDAGAKTAELMISAVASVLKSEIAVGQIKP